MTSVTRSSAMAMPVAINKRMINLSLAQTPGGSIYGTTPGGTRVTYSLRDLMRLSQSPMSRTLPANLPLIPGITVEDGVQGGSRSSSPVSLQSPMSSSPGANDSGLGNAEVRITLPARTSTGVAAAEGDGHHVNQNWPGFVIQRQRTSNSFSQGDLPVKSRVISGGSGDAHQQQPHGGSKLTSNSSGTAVNKPALSNNNSKQNIGRSHELPANWRDHPDMWAKPPNKNVKKPPQSTTTASAASAVSGDTAAAGAKDQATGAAKKRRHHHKKHAATQPTTLGADSQQTTLTQQQQQQQQRAQAAVAARGARRRRTVSETQVEERKKSDGAMEGFAKKLTSQNKTNDSNANIVQPQRSNTAAVKPPPQQPPKSIRRTSGKILRTEDSVAEENENDADGEQFELDV